MQTERAAALRCRVSAAKDSNLISCSDVDCGKTESDGGEEKQDA